MSKAQEAQQFLNDLEQLAPPNATATAAAPGTHRSSTPSKPTDASEALAFLDEITQKSSEPTPRTGGLLERPSSRAGTPTLRKSTERVRMGAPSSLTRGDSASPAPSPSRGAGPSATVASTSTSASASALAADQEQRAGWGWGSVWSSASTVIQQARSVVDEQVKTVQQNEQAKRWAGGAIEYAKSAQEFAAKNAQEYAKNAQEYAKNAQLDKIGALVIASYCCSFRSNIGDRRGSQTGRS